MKNIKTTLKVAFVFIFIFGTAFIANAQYSIESKASWRCQQNRIHHKYITEDKSVSTPLHAFNALKYSLNLDLFACYTSPYPNSFHGSEILRFEVDTALNNIKLNAINTSIVIDSVRLSGTTFSHTNDILIINLDRTYNAGEITEVKIYYHHLDIDDNAFYTGNGFAYTDAEPDRARYWFPCWDKPADKALFDVTAKVPDNVLFASNGSLADSTHVNNSIFYHWTSRDPMATYLMVITSKAGYNLDVLYWPMISSPSTKIPIRYYYNSGEDPSGSENVILDMTTFYSTIFCEHPFEKNGFCSLDNQFLWGGMENQTLTSYCAGCWDANLTSHEFGHQWFGDMITCGTWADVWLNEGFATYIEALWYEHTSGYTAYKNDIDGDANYYLGNNPGWAISVPAWAVTTPNMNDLFNYAITYCKGASVLHMYRYVAGDTLFFASLKAYASDTLNFKYKNAEIADFKTKMNQVSGQNMDWFFDEWLYQPNHPVYDNKYSFTDNGNGTWTTNFLAKQVQTNAGFFKMPIALKITFNDATDTTVKVMNDQNNQLFQFIFSKQPIALAFDPDNDIVLKEGTTSLGIKDVSNITSSAILYQNNPNPFSGTTQISFYIPNENTVKIAVYDMFGKEVAVVLNEKMLAGKHEVEFNAKKLSSGEYYYSLECEGSSTFQKMIIAH
jgi:aminopeptidase N